MKPSNTRALLAWETQEDSASQVLETLKMIGDKGHALLMLDRELGRRGAGESGEDGE